MTQTCAACGRTRECVNHHISYNPERTVPICRSCHSKIHSDEVFQPELTPDEVPERRRSGTQIPISGETRERLKWVKILTISETYDEAIDAIIEEAGFDIPDEPVAEARDKRVTLRD